MENVKAAPFKKLRYYELSNFLGKGAFG